MMKNDTEKLSKVAQNRSENDNQGSSSLTTIQIIAAIVTLIIGIIACGWGTYAVVQQEAHTPKRLMNNCKNSIKQIERNLSKQVA